MKADDKFGDLHPADVVRPDTNDMHLGLLVTLSEFRGDPRPVLSADLRQMLLGALELKVKGEAIVARLGRSQPEFLPPSLTCHCSPTELFLMSRFLSFFPFSERVAI